MRRSRPASRRWGRGSTTWTSAACCTAPDHFLGDYPDVKFQRFAHALPADLTGKSVLDIGCNGGFYSMEMKRRGAARVLGIDCDEHYLAQARFAADVAGLDIEFAQLSVYDVGALGERFDIVIFMGVLYHLRHPLLALDLIREHVAGDLLLFQSMQRGSREVDAAGGRLRLQRDRAVRARRLSRACISSSSSIPAIRPTGGSPTAPARSDAALVRFRHPRPPGGRGFLCRCAEVAARRRRLSRARDRR